MESISKFKKRSHNDIEHHSRVQHTAEILLSGPPLRGIEQYFAASYMFVQLIELRHGSNFQRHQMLSTLMYQQELIADQFKFDTHLPSVESPMDGSKHQAAIIGAVSLSFENIIAKFNLICSCVTNDSHLRHI